MGRADARVHFGVTEAGRVVFRGTVFVALAALIVPIFGVLSVLVCVLFMACLIGLLVRPKVRISGTLPDRVIAGHTTRLTYAIENIGRLPAYNLCVRFGSLPAPIEQLGGEHVVSRLCPGQSADVTVTIRPKRRGVYAIAQPVCQSSFPFNLFWFGTAGRGTESLIVLPVFSRLEMQTVGLGRYVQAGGVWLAGRTGVCPEYVGSRPFLPGDSPRRIDARAWARLAAPATKEYDENCDNYAAVILDTQVPPAAGRTRSGEIAELEAAISLCASVVFTMNDDCLIDLFLAGADLHQFAGRPRQTRLDRIHEVLAGAEPRQGDVPQEVVLAVADRFRQMSHVVFILLDWTRTHRQLLDLAERAGCHCTVVLVGESKQIGTDDADWGPTVQILSPDEILAGHVRQL